MDSIRVNCKATKFCWTDVSKLVPGRTSKQCRERYHSHSIPKSAPAPSPPKRRASSWSRSRWKRQKSGAKSISGQVRKASEKHPLQCGHNRHNPTKIRNAFVKIAEPYLRQSSSHRTPRPVPDTLLPVKDKVFALADSISSSESSSKPPSPHPEVKFPCSDVDITLSLDDVQSNLLDFTFSAEDIAYLDAPVPSNVPVPEERTEKASCNENVIPVQAVPVFQFQSALADERMARRW